ncbi:glycoside hydrolase family 43 protein [Alkalibacterium sp. f15]|uniref:glycoside hydrolase family 43 protein n=1 Tax=Alkalibacterium sp. f15 TaxID=3414029 RepID=UPI003BF87ED1
MNNEQTDSTQESVTYTNPVGEMSDIGDPYVLKVEDTYYMYATSVAHAGFKVWESTDMVEWVEVGMAYDHRDHEEKWAQYDFWAPEVIEHNGTFYMVYSARAYNGSLKMAIATSDSPTGPFMDATVGLIDRPGSFIDGHFFIDDDDKAYMYYVEDNHENIVDGNHVSHVYVQEMTDDLLNVTGEPHLLLEPDQAWENPHGEYQWNEGPFVVKHDDLYYLMYSANFYASSDYAVGYAVSDNPLGPFEKSESNPILSKDMENGISGPGHNSVTVGLDDETLYAVYHVHTDPENPTGDRRPAIDRLYFEDGEMKIGGPTSDEQELR